MRHALIITTLVAIGSAAAVRGDATDPAPQRDEPALSRKDILTWPSARVERFGCFLEQAFGHKDRRFNCALKGYVNHGDPCRKVDAWMEGPEFPADKVALVHPLAREIELKWEHGDLQAVVVRFSKRMSPQEVWKALGVRDPGRSTRPNVMSADVQQSGATILIVEGFDHMGAGEADCGP